MLDTIKVRSAFTPFMLFCLGLLPYLDFILENLCNREIFCVDYSFYFANSCILRVKDSVILLGDKDEL